MKPDLKDHLALCSLGHLGLVTCAAPQRVCYVDGNEATAWTGVKGDGRPWSSRRPRILGHVEGWRNSGKPLAEWANELLGEERFPDPLEDKAFR